MKLKDIEDLMICKKDITDPYFSLGHNKAIDLQGEREITLNREKLAEVILNCECQYPINVADAIISSLPSIVEVKE